MGEESTRKPVAASAANQGSVNPRTDGTRNGTAGNPRPAAPAPRPAPAAGGNRPAAPARTAAPAEEKKVSGLASVKAETPAVPAPEEPKKKQQRKPRKKKEEPQTFNADQISALILSMSTIVASRPEMQIWQLSAAEANQLATPIANMAAKSEKLQNMGEYSDAIALVTASLVIFAPRAFAQAELTKQKKIQNSGGVKLVRTDSKEGKVSGSNAKPAGKPSTPSPEYDSGFRSAIPATIY